MSFGAGQFGGIQFGTGIQHTGPVAPVIRQLISKSSMLSYMRIRLNDTNKVLWNDAILSQLINQAEVWCGDLINTLWIRFPLPIQSGLATYDLTAQAIIGPVKYITRITYRGFKVDVLTQKQLSLLSPVYRTQQTRPRWASWQFDGQSIIRLYPVPAENLPILDTNGQQYTDANLLNQCVISAYIYPVEGSANFSIPDYFVRRVVKYFVLWKAYGLEGPGQNQEIAAYYKKKFDVTMFDIAEANMRVYNNVNKQLADVAIQRPWKKHRPILPPQFGTPVDMF